MMHPREAPAPTAGHILVEALAHHGITAQLEDDGDGALCVVHRFDGGDATFSNGERADYDPAEHTGWYAFVDDRHDYREMHAPPNTDCGDDCVKTAASYARWLTLRDTAGHRLLDALFQYGIFSAELTDRPGGGTALVLPHGEHRILIADRTSVLYAPADHQGWRAVLVNPDDRPVAELYAAAPGVDCGRDSDACAAVLDAWLSEHPAQDGADSR
jgi:hypothetical protein